MLSEPDFEESLARTDDSRREIEIKACNEHLNDLLAAHGAPPLRVQPSYPRILPWPAPTLVPAPDR